MGHPDLSFIMDQFEERSWRVTRARLGGRLGGEGQKTRDKDNWGPGPPPWFISEPLGSFESTHASPLKRQKIKHPWPGLPHLIKPGSLGSGLPTGESVSFKSFPCDSDEQLKWRTQLQVKTKSVINDTMKELGEGRFLPAEQVEGGSQ